MRMESVIGNQSHYTMLGVLVLGHTMPSNLYTLSSFPLITKPCVLAVETRKLPWSRFYNMKECF